MASEAKNESSDNKMKTKTIGFLCASMIGALVVKAGPPMFNPVQVWNLYQPPRMQTQEEILRRVAAQTGVDTTNLKTETEVQNALFERLAGQVRAQSDQIIRQNWIDDDVFSNLLDQANSPIELCNLYWQMVERYSRIIPHLSGTPEEICAKIEPMLNHCLRINDKASSLPDRQRKVYESMMQQRSAWIKQRSDACWQAISAQMLNNINNPQPFKIQDSTTTPTKKINHKKICPVHFMEYDDRYPTGCAACSQPDFGSGKTRTCAYHGCFLVNGVCPQCRP